MMFLQFLNAVVPYISIILFLIVYRMQFIHIDTLRKQNKLLDKQNIVLIELIESLRDDPNAF
jgi:hypothetical protein